MIWKRRVAPNLIRFISITQSIIEIEFKRTQKIVWTIKVKFAKADDQWQIIITNLESALTNSIIIEDI